MTGSKALASLRIPPTIGEESQNPALCDFQGNTDGRTLSSSFQLLLLLGLWGGTLGLLSFTYFLSLVCLFTSGPYELLLPFLQKRMFQFGGISHTTVTG